MLKAAVVRFPGSNCDRDCFHVLQDVLGADTRFLWHKDHNKIKDLDLVVLPGGFSYGDYLRCGAIARFSPVMQEVIEFAERGGMVVGICNGFQILTEAQLLPGMLVRNRSLKFICKYINLRVENTKTQFTSKYNDGEVINIPIAHGEGNYTVEDDVWAEMQANSQVVFRYCSADGSVDAASNPNGSRDNVAGIVNKRGNVLGMMPHPERAAEPLMKTAHGYRFFESIKNVFA
ncbi:MAG: phosphoribosylformylglycinamidine synthase subunit PurQ [Deferribacteraceae bacterium]|jgi:phosphoribosylformylglycinamidine synthase|nr:phosphoribosylformylglycinamidine synthase subunit PurQ [Deferribacteraceae bacterium]